MPSDYILKSYSVCVIWQWTALEWCHWIVFQALPVVQSKNGHTNATVMLDPPECSHALAKYQLVSVIRHTGVFTNSTYTYLHAPVSTSTRQHIPVHINPAYMNSLDLRPQTSKALVRKKKIRQ